MTPKKICIITPAYISSSPRVVKEADALRQAGFDVRVVFSQGSLASIRDFDKILLKEKTWRWSSVGWSSSRRDEAALYWKSKFRYHVARGLPSLFWQFGKLAESAEGRIYKELAELAVLEKADLYIGHYTTGLAAAGYAAYRFGTKFAYDAEDLHAGETPDNKNGTKQKKRIGLIESRYVSRCAYVSAVSTLVADELVKRYNISSPITVHNVFSWGERAKIDGQIKDRKGNAISLYWYSQVIGEDRGIQDVIRAAGLLKGSAQIHLRGYLSQEIKNKFLALAQETRVEKNLYFHPPVPPAELLSRAAEHDIGLALEQPNSLNHQLTVSNKLFIYLLAGLAVAATNVPGQGYVMGISADAGFLYKPGDFHSLADGLNKLIVEPARLKFCKEAALKAARDKWNWENESDNLVKKITHLLNG